MWLETHIDELPVPKEAIQELLQEDWQVIDGYIELPTKPGLGFEIDAAEAEQNLDMYE
jgi:L-alanine-DL-glutamate epimerase-like enolase superfamily enzyme